MAGSVPRTVAGGAPAADRGPPPRPAGTRSSGAAHRRPRVVGVGASAAGRLLAAADHRALPGGTPGRRLGGVPAGPEPATGRARPRPRAVAAGPGAPGPGAGRRPRRIHRYED